MKQLAGLVELLLAACVMSLTAGVYAADNWIAREKIRAGWIYHSDGVDKIALFKRHGLNALITHAGRDGQSWETFQQWAREAKHVGLHLFGVISASLEAQKIGARRCVFGNGYESDVPCPLDVRYWEEGLIRPAERLAHSGRQADMAIAGLLIDWELYANEAKGGQIYYTDACYCDACFSAFLRSQGHPDLAPQIPYKERVTWLKAQGLQEKYQPFLQQRVRALAEQMRERVHAANPDFFVGFYPVPHNWHLRGVAQGLGRPEHPLILWATSTYGGGGPRAIPDDWREQMQKDGIFCYYAGGMLLRFYSAANLAKNIFEIARKTDGYWLFTVHTLCIPEEEQNTDYYLAAGTPTDYLREISRANQELDRLQANPQYQTSLQYVPEPIRYRHVGFDVKRFRPPVLREESQAPRGQNTDVPPFTLSWSNYLMMLLQAGEAPTLTFAVQKAQSGDLWGVSYAVLDPHKKIIAQGQMPPGETYTLHFTPTEAGLHTIVLTAGYYAAATVKMTTTPFALWTGDRYQVAGPGGMLYFFVPENIAEFSIQAQCEWGTAQVALTVFNPQGQIVVTQPTDAYVRQAKLVVPTGGQSGVWALRVEKIPDKAFRAVTIVFDRALPPAVTLKPEWIFR